MAGRPLTNHVGETIGSLLAERPFRSRNVFYRIFLIGKDDLLADPSGEVALKKLQVC
jgi:hypothetical protein